MTDYVWSRAEIDSPCVKLCVIHPEARLCIGCYRSLDEIAAWPRMSPEARRTAMAELGARAPLVAPKRQGGRAARLRNR